MWLEKSTKAQKVVFFIITDNDRVYGYKAICGLHSVVKHKR